MQCVLVFQRHPRLFFRGPLACFSEAPSLVFQKRGLLTRCEPIPFRALFPAHSACGIFCTSICREVVVLWNRSLHTWTAEFLSTFWQADFPAILAALLFFVFSVLREAFASLFQTFSRSDPPGKKRGKKRKILWNRTSCKTSCCMDLSEGMGSRLRSS